MPDKVMAKQFSAKRRLMAQRDSETEAVVTPQKSTAPKPGKVSIPENSPLTPKPGKTIQDKEPKFQIPENNLKPKTYASAATAIFETKNATAKRRKRKPFVRAAQRKLYG